MRIVRWSLVALLAGATACSNGGSDKKHGNGSGDGSGGLDSGTGEGGAGGGDGAGDGAGDGIGGDGNGSSDGGSFCDTFAINAKPIIPDMLIVFDRSASMNQTKDNNGNFIDRWTPSVAALKSVTSQLDTTLRFGLMIFPKPCAKDDIFCLNSEATVDHCGTGTLEVPLAIDSSADIAAALDATIPGGGTPTGATLQAALETFANAPIDPDAPTPPKYVLLVTDGQPSCPNGDGLAAATPQQLSADLQLAIDKVDALKAADVKTYVIGYTENLPDSLKNALTQLAAHGGTTSYFTVQNESELVTAFKKIAGQVVPCDFTLEKKPDDPSYVQIKLDGKQVNLDDPNGWKIDDKKVTLQGDACKTLQDGGPHQLSVNVLCTVVVPI